MGLSVKYLFRYADEGKDMIHKIITWYETRIYPINPSQSEPQ